MMPQREDRGHKHLHTPGARFAEYIGGEVTSVVEKERVAGSAFGELLRRHRLAAGLSQEDLAEQARMSARAIGALERGDRRYPYRDTVALLTKALNLAPVAAAELEAAAARPRLPHGRVDPGAAASDGRGPTMNLPLQRTSLVGREADVADIVGMLQESRLVTVTGAGGVGKTRVALAVGEVLAGDTCVWLVELAPVAQGSFVAAAVARALSVQESPNRPLMETLLAYLKPRALVLIMDNCEHVIAEVAALADALLRGCPNVRILGTSREPVRIAGEQTYRLPSLPVPTAGESAGLSTARASQYPAVVLFAQRALAVDHGFALNDDNAPTIGEICRRLDGIPLAVELAAARVNVFPVRALSQQLDQRFRVLTNGDRTALLRHRTMRAALDWSHDLLEERDRTHFRRLGIFVNGFTFDAALAVAADDGFSEFDVFDALASLVEKSLVMADPLGDSARYRLLESTRVYAVEKLVEAGERDALASRHLRYFRDWFVELRRQREELRDSLEATFPTELEDLRVALDGALVRRELADGAELLAAIGSFWARDGLGREGVARCEAFLAELPRSEPRLLSEVGASLTNILLNMGRITQAREAGVAAVGYARASGDGPILAAALYVYAYVLLVSRDFPATECALSEAQAIPGVSPLRRLVLAQCRASLSVETGDLDLAAHTFARLREDWRLAGFPVNEALATAHLGDIQLRHRQYGPAADLFREAASLARNDHASALSPPMLVSFGQALALDGTIGGAVRPAIDAIMALGRRDPRHFFITLAIELLAYVAAEQGDLERSARLAGYADASLARIGYLRDSGPLAVRERLMTRLNAHLAPAEFARLSAEGGSLTPEAAIALARTLETNAGSQLSLGGDAVGDDEERRV